VFLAEDFGDPNSAEATLSSAAHEYDWRSFRLQFPLENSIDGLVEAKTGTPKKKRGEQRVRAARP
jgi:hypothetical protein